MPTKTRHKPGESSGSHAVILIHGVLGQAFVYWNLVKRYMRSDQFHFHEIRLPFFGFGDLRKSAKHIAKEVDTILRDCADEAHEHRVDIIAHSAGGLAARYYVRELGGDKRVHTLVTLGTPHHGTYTGSLFPLNKVARQTAPNSPFLRRLNDGPDTAEPIHYVSIFSKTDGIVIPARNARLEGALNVEIPYLTHWGFLWSKDVYRYMREAIDHPPGGYPSYGPGKTPPRRRGTRTRTRSRARRPTT